MTSPRDRFRDRRTGKPPTEEEWQSMLERAHRILEHYQYHPPESVEWAVQVDPSYAERIHG